MAFKKESRGFSNKEELFASENEHMEIVSDKGYNIYRPDKVTGISSKEESLHEVGLEKLAKKVQEKSTETISPSSRESRVERTDPTIIPPSGKYVDHFEDQTFHSGDDRFEDSIISNFGPAENSYIYWDETNWKGDPLRPIEDTGHDKMALRETSTSAGGGADIKYHFKQNGKLEADIELFKNRDRTDRQRFRDKGVAFVEKMDDVFDVVRPEDNMAAASNVDQKIERQFVRAGQKHSEKATRYRSIQREGKKELKQLKKEEKALAQFEQSDSQIGKKGPEEKDLFKESQAEFKESDEKFVDIVEKKFDSGKPEKKEKFVTSKAPIPQKTDELALPKANEKQGIENKHFPSARSDETFTESKTGPAEGKFENQTVNGKYSDSQQEINSRFMTNEEKQSQVKSKNKEAKKQEKKEIRKAAALTAVSGMFRAKREIQNYLGDMSGSGTGDLMKDGSGGILSAITGMLTNSLKEAFLNPIKAIIAKLGCFLLVPMIVVCIVASLITMITDVGDALSSIFFEPGEEMLVNSLTAEEIDGIIESLYLSYPDDMDSTRETLLRYSLGKVGGEYCQIHRLGSTVQSGKICDQPHGIKKMHHGMFSYDCSGFAYMSYKQVSVDISNYGSSTAAEEAKKMVRLSKGVSNSELLPGDLIFYGGKNNGRYLGIYHVAIYAGNGMSVEAANTRTGVVYRNLPTDDIVYVARPLS